jgi:hypothetical protein
MQVSLGQLLLQNIFRELEPKELAISSAVCKLWNDLISDEEFNRYLLFREFPTKILYAPDFQSTNRQLYMSLQRNHWNMRRGQFKQSSSLTNQSLTNYTECTPDRKRMLSFNRIDHTFEVTILGDQKTSITMDGHKYPINEVRCLNNESAISASRNELKKWNLFTGCCQAQALCDGGLVGLEIIYEKGVILTASKDTNSFTQWSYQLEPLKRLHTSFSGLSSMTLSFDRKTVVTCDFSRKKQFASHLQFWNLHDMTLLHSVHFPDGISYDFSSDDEEWTSTTAISKVIFSEDGSKIFLLSGPQFKNTDIVASKLSAFMVTLDFSSESSMNLCDGITI